MHAQGRYYCTTRTSGGADPLPLFGGGGVKMEGSRRKGMPAWLLSGDVELNPGPKTRAADKEVDQIEVSEEPTAKQLKLEVPSSKTLAPAEVSGSSPAPPPPSPPPVLQVVAPVQPDQIPQLTLTNITKYIPQILEIKAPKLELWLAVKDAPASSVEEVLSAWLAGKGAPPSWRRLIWALDEVENCIPYKGPKSVADNIRKFAEPPQESTLSVENVAAVLMLVERDVSSVLDEHEFTIGCCPQSVHSRISSLSGEEKIRAAASLYTTSHGCPSWKSLAVLLYGVEELKAAERAMTNFSKDPTFTAESFSEVLKEVEDWETIANYMGIVDHAMSQIESAHDQKGALVHHLVHVCPYVTWGNVVTALSHCGEEIAAEQAAKYLPKGSNFSFENAQRYTFVWGDWGAHFSLEEFLTTRAITSWRKLISIIDSEGEHCKYADSIRNFAEPVTDPTMTVENLTTVLTSAEESSLDIINHTEPFRNLMERIESYIPSVEQQAKAAAMCYISSYPEQPTWKDIATAALGAQEVEATIKACDYCTKDSNFSIERISKVLEEVEDWDQVALFLSLPESLIDRIKSSESTGPKQALAEIMVRLNPALDWDGFSRALSDAGYHALAEDVTTKYVKA